MMNKNIGLGCMRINKLTVDEAEELILCAVNNGVILFDHADIYGNRRCEEIFGEVLRRNSHLRKKIIVQSKCGICNGYYDLSKEHIINQVVKSIQLLNCDYLDILLLHRPDVLVNYEEVNDAFNYLYTNGLVKKFGVSNMNPMQIELYNSKLVNKIEFNQIQFSILHSKVIDESIFVNMSENESSMKSGGLLEYAMLREIKLQAWSPLMASWEEGVFLDNPKYTKLNELLSELAMKYNCTPNAVAISWILRHPAKIMPIIGTTSKIHLLEILKAFDIELSKKEWYALYLAAGHMLP